MQCRSKEKDDNRKKSIGNRVFDRPWLTLWKFKINKIEYNRRTKKKITDNVPKNCLVLDA